MNTVTVTQPAPQLYSLYREWMRWHWHRLKHTLIYTLLVVDLQCPENNLKRNLWDLILNGNVKYYFLKTAALSEWPACLRRGGLACRGHTASVHTGFTSALVYICLLPHITSDTSPFSHSYLPHHSFLRCHTDIRCLRLRRVSVHVIGRSLFCSVSWKHNHM